MQEIVDKSSGAILFKKSESELKVDEIVEHVEERDKRVSELEDALSEIKKQMALLMKQQKKTTK